MFKTCPLCGALVFKDMDQCFECLHVFGDEVPDIEEAHHEGLPSLEGYESAMAAVLSAAESMQQESAENQEAEVGEDSCALLTGSMKLVEKSAPEGALEIRMRFEGPLADYFKALANASSACF